VKRRRSFVGELIWRARGIRNRTAQKLNRSLAVWILELSVWQARKKIAKQGQPVRVLVDVSVLYHAVTHKTSWVSLGPVAGYLARIPVHHHATQSREYENIKCLAGIAHLAKIGAIELLTSAELLDEQFNQPIGRFRGYGVFDHSLIKGPLKSVDGNVIATMGPSYFKLAAPKAQQRTRLKEKEQLIPEYGALVRCLGRKNSNDAWHVFTAEHHGLFCYLTMDFKFVHAVSAQARNEAIKRLKAKMMLPTEFAAEFGIIPLSPTLLSHQDARSIVHPELTMPGNERRPRNRYRKQNG
jgi:hypothetical protein